MVVQGIIALALALPTGMLFGVGYGTGVRIGYEQVYPLLFPKDSENRNVTPTVENIKQMNNIYNTIGGKEASQMGIAVGLSGAMSELNKNPDFQDLVELELKLSGNTLKNSEETLFGQMQDLDSESDLSLSDFIDNVGNPLSANNPALYSFILKEQGDNAQTETNFNERKVKLRILIQKMSSSQIKSAYSDMLSGRLKPSWTQKDSQFKQILTLEFKKLGAGTRQIPTPTIDADIDALITPTTPHQQIQVDYHTKKIQIIATAVPHLKEFAGWKHLSQDSRSSANVANGNAGMKRAQKKIDKVKQTLKFFIQRSRNVLSTKAVANTDWRNRIWKNIK